METQEIDDVYFDIVIGETAPSITPPTPQYGTFKGYKDYQNTQIINSSGAWIRGTEYVDTDGKWIRPLGSTLNLTPIFERYKYTITHEEPDHQGKFPDGYTPPTQAEYGVEFNLPNREMVHTSYAFLGWHIQTDDYSKAQYSSSGNAWQSVVNRQHLCSNGTDLTKFKNLATSNNASIKFYPRYERLATLTVNNGNGGGRYPATTSVSVGTKATPYGMYFTGWTWTPTHVNLTFTHDTSADTTIARFIMPAWDLVMTANFKYIESTVTANLTLDGEPMHGKTVTLQLRGEDIYELEQVEDGKYTTSGVIYGDYDICVDGNPIGVNLTVDSESIDTITIDCFTVNFVAYGGTHAPATQYIIRNGYVAEPAEMVRNDDSQLYWYTDSDYTQMWTFSSSKITNTTTLYAKWELRTYIISLSQSDTYTFPSLDRDYMSSERTEMTTFVMSYSTRDTGVITIALSGANADCFELSTNNLGVIPLNGNKIFTVKPKYGLPAGTYTATVTVGMDDGLRQMEPKSFNVSFTVNTPKLAAPGNPRWALHQGSEPGTTAYCDAVRFTEHYKLQLYKVDGEDAVEVGGTPTPTAQNHDFSAIMARNGGGDYYFKVMAVGDGNTYVNSDWSEPSDTYTYTEESVILGVAEHSPYRIGYSVYFEAASKGMSIINPKLGDWRIIPRSWSVEQTDISGSWSGYPFLADFSTSGLAAGKYTLTVTFTEQRYQLNNTWLNIRNEDVSVEFEVIRAAIDRTLKVSGGTGSGTYREDSEVLVTAPLPDKNKRFMYWKDVATNKIADWLTFTLGSATSPRAVFIMPSKNLQLTAAYYSLKDESKLTLPRSMVAIAEGAFAGAAFRDVICPDGLTSISAHAFAHCNKLRSIMIPASVIRIAPSAFEGSSGFTILCTEGSYAMDYAISAGIDYQIYK